MPESAHQNRQ